MAFPTTKVRKISEALKQKLGAIAYRPMNELKTGAGYARRHPKAQLVKIGASLDTFGFVLPVLVDASGTIIDGHACVEAAREIGLVEVPTLVIDHLPPEQVRVLRLALNRLSELADWDEPALGRELAALMSFEFDFSLEITGWSAAEIDILIDTSSLGADADAEDEVVPDPERVAISRQGDLWLLGEHRLLNASSIETENWPRLMDRAEGAMVFSDPPYNVPIKGHVSGLGKKVHNDFAMAAGEMSEPEFIQFLTNALTAMASVLREGALLDVCMDFRGHYALETAARAAGLTLINMCVWNKGSGGMGSLYRGQYELVLVLKKGKAPHTNNVQLGKFGRYRTNVWDYAGANSFGRTRDQDLADHPTVKPTALVADAIRDVSNRGDIVIDGFMGSGSTLLAADRTGRRAFGMELDGKYVDVAIRRWQEATGGDAMLEETGETFAEVSERRFIEQTPTALPSADEPSGLAA